MAVKPAAARIRDAFAQNEAAREYGESYLDHLIENTNAAAEAVRRSAGLVIGAVIAFFLFSGAKTTEVSLGPLKLTGVSAVLTLIPALASFFFYEYVANAYARLRYEMVKDEVVAELYPALYRNDLEQLLSPPTLQAWGSEPSQLLPSTHLGLESKVLDLLGDAVILGIAIGIVAFLSDAYVRLFSDAKTNVYAVSASAAFAAVNLIRAFLTVLEARRQGMPIV